MSTPHSPSQPYAELPGEEQTSRGPAAVKKNRLQSVDVLRGAAGEPAACCTSESADCTAGAAAVWAMLFVNHAGRWPWWLPHAAWSGLHLADTVMPTFLVVVGVSLAISSAAAAARGTTRLQFLGRATSRAAKLFTMGLFLQGAATKK